MDGMKKKKIIAVVLIAAIAIGSIFASPLTLVGSIGNAKVYDDTFKSVENANSVNDGWIVRTGENIVVFENESFRLKIGENSLVRVLGLDNTTPVVYLLDGWLGATTAENVSITVKTPVTVYSATAGSTLVVLSNKTAENGYIYKGSAIFTNEVTSAVTEVKEDTYLDLAQKSAMAQKTEEGTEIAITVEKYLAEEAKTEASAETVVAEVATKPEASAETGVALETSSTEAEDTVEITAEASAETSTEVSTEVKINPLKTILSYAGYKATITAYVGKAYIEYPTFITAQEIYDAAAAAYNAYGEYLDGVYIQVVEDGLAVVTYPESYGEVEFNIVISILRRELPYYIASLFGTSDISDTEVKDYLVIGQPVTFEPKSKPTAKENVTVIPLTRTFSYAGFRATITAYIGEAYLEYPTYVTAQEIYEAATAAYNAYPTYLADIYIRVVDNGLAVVTFPKTYGEPEFNLAMSLLDREIPYYLANVLNIEGREETAEVKTDENEATVIEVTAPEIPAPPTIEKPAEEKKKANVKFGATIGVVYGQYTEGSEFKQFINKDVFLNVGFAPKNVVVNLDPYITIGNFTFGLHASINVLDFKGSFTFTTDNGAIGYINSIANYIGRVNYNGKAFNLSIDRTHSVEFSSPVFYSLDKAFDLNNSLVATSSINLGFLTINTFIDDLQLTNLINEKDQFAGLSLSTGSKHVTVNASVIANFHSLSSIDFYPAFDATAKVVNGDKLNVDIYAGIASLFSLNNSSTELNLLAKAKLTLSTKAFSFGVGAAYNKGDHINNVVNNSPVSIVKAFNGQSIDVLVSTDLNLGVFSLNSSLSIPLSLNEGEKLAYNTVKTRSGNQIDITTDVFSLSASLNFNHFAFTSGLLFEGFTGRFDALTQALINKTDTSSALGGLVDPELATLFAQMTFNFGGFEVYLRGDLATIDSSKNVAISLGASFTF